MKLYQEKTEGESLFLTHATKIVNVCNKAADLSPKVDGLLLWDILRVRQHSAKWHSAEWHSAKWHSAEGHLKNDT